MANLFDDDSNGVFVFINEEEEHSLWPYFADVPAGWQVIYGKADRAACLDYIERNWADIRSNSRRARARADLLARRPSGDGDLGDLGELGGA